MSKSSSKELFDFIKSLNKLEKRYFKVFASRHVIGEENKYVKLLNLIDRQTHYDEKNILKKAAITKKQLENWKRYLYKLMLRSEENYHFADTAEKKIKHLTLHAEILFEKKLYGQSMKLLEKAKQLAEKYEKHLLVFEILTWEEIILRRMSNIKYLEKYIVKRIKEKEQALKKISTINEYRNLYSQQYLISNKEWISRSSKNTMQFSTIAEHPLVKDKKLATTYEAKAWHYYLQCSNYIFTGKFKNAYYTNKKRIAFIEQHPHQIAEDPFHYIYALHNFAFICDHLGETKEFLNALQKLKTIPVKTVELYNKILSLTYYYELSQCIKNGQYFKGIGLIEEIQKELDQLGDTVDKHFKLLLHYNISILYFATEDYHAALRWLNMILNDPEKDLRKDIYCFARILNLIVHFELGNQELLKSAVKSTYWFLNKRKKLFAVETTMLNFIRNKAFKMDTPIKRMESFKELRKEIEQITKSDFEKKALDYFDIISWIESKIKNIPFAEIVKARQGRYSPGKKKRNLASK